MVHVDDAHGEFGEWKSVLGVFGFRSGDCSVEIFAGRGRLGRWGGWGLPHFVNGVEM